MQTIQNDARLIFDNGGGITLQLGGFAFYTSDATQAAQLWQDFQKSGSTAGWDGHDEDAAECDPTGEEIRNGGYRVLTADDIAREIAREIASDETTGWLNIDRFIQALA